MNADERGKIAEIKCPFCSSADNEMIALFGQQMLTSQYYCNNCRTGFEAIKNPNSKFEVKAVIASEAKQSP